MIDALRLSARNIYDWMDVAFLFHDSSRSLLRHELMNREEDSIITIIGRGNSGTRLIAQTLHETDDIYMGEKFSARGDKQPYSYMYEMARMAGENVKYLGNYEWDFSDLINTLPPDKYKNLFYKYINDLLNNDSKYVGWKLPETTLSYPWLVNLMPNMRFIIIVRDPRDCVVNGHATDNLEDWNVEYDKEKLENLDDEEKNQKRKCISWKYQYDLINSIPLPKNHIVIRFEDMCLKQDEILLKINNFLGINNISKHSIIESPVGRHLSHPEQITYYPFLNKLMDQYGYTLNKSETCWWI